MKKTPSRIVILSILVLILGITYFTKESKKEPHVQEQNQILNYESWIGTWTGPEGTSLTVTQQEEGRLYGLYFVMLDGPIETIGTPTENGIAFNRLDGDFTLTHGTGEDTGMKWLLEKNDCLVVQQSEGYCRD
jgi:hypothetical protein